MRIAPQVGKCAKADLPEVAPGKVVSGYSGFARARFLRSLIR